MTLKLSHNLTINNHKQSSRINSNKMPDLEPVLEFDTNYDDESHNQYNNCCDEIDGNVHSQINNDLNENSYSSCDTDTDNGYTSKKSSFIPTQALVSKQAPAFLLIESLVWKICVYNEPDYEKRKKMFRSICKVFKERKLIGDTYELDALQPIRDRISIRITQLIEYLKLNSLSLPNNSIICRPTADSSSSVLYPCPSQLVLDDAKNIENDYRNVNHPINIASRYRDEFEDLGLIENGGFGVVNKVKHRFDNCLYAIKMISFRYKTDVAFNKITREVQLYANLASHPNVVSYKTSWLENWCLHNGKLPDYSPKISEINGDNRHPLHDKVHNPLHYVNLNDNLNDNLNEIRLNESSLYSKQTDDGLSIRFEENSKSSIRFENSETVYNKVEYQLKNENLKFEEIDDDDDDDDDVSVHSDPGIKSDHLFNTIYDGTVMRRQKTTSVSSTKSLSDSVIEYGISNFVPPNYYKRPLPEVESAEYQSVKGMCSYGCVEYGAILYIQMELCGKNLKTFLRERNSHIFEKCGNGKRRSATRDLLNNIDERVSLAIFRQVLKGVNFFHSKHLIHRDLKPQNILFSNDDDADSDKIRVKIGDFGLATLHHSIDNKEISLNQNFHQQNNNPNHTEGLGTSIYAAPEQRESSKYDITADMYSLGIILFELFFPFATEMEKIKCVDDIIKSHVLPQSLVKKWPIVAEMIFLLTEKNASLRPTAMDVLNSSLFLSKEQQRIKRLEEQLLVLTLKLDLKDREANVLRSVLAIKDDQISKKDNENMVLKERIRRMKSDE